MVFVDILKLYVIFRSSFTRYLWKGAPASIKGLSFIVFVLCQNF